MARPRLPGCSGGWGIARGGRYRHGPPGATKPSPATLPLPAGPTLRPPGTGSGWPWPPHHRVSHRCRRHGGWHHRRCRLAAAGHRHARHPGAADARHRPDRHRPRPVARRRGGHEPGRNAAANAVTGNEAANLLSGGASADTLEGAGGNDVLFCGLLAATASLSRAPPRRRSRPAIFSSPEAMMV
ncbi:hypothetical protein [Belnapia rosea]|uniref:hypothetical protein n=1 Tax=Belnapia rosea TaxID=938405 RepID=UPI0015A07A35